MSLCSWSSMNWACDLYVYESAYDGWTIHVAGRRIVGKLPPDPLLSIPKAGSSDEDMAEWSQRSRRHRKALNASETEVITLPHAGETFNLATPGEAADKVEQLIALGYNCPDYVVPELRAEQAELLARWDSREPSTQPTPTHQEPAK